MDNIAINDLTDRCERWEWVVPAMSPGSGAHQTTATAAAAAATASTTATASATTATISTTNEHAATTIPIPTASRTVGRCWLFSTLPIHLAFHSTPRVIP